LILDKFTNTNNQHPYDQGRHTISVMCWFRPGGSLTLRGSGDSVLQTNTAWEDLP
jgi:hypothetical protein